MTELPTFEKSYWRYEFSELVHLGIVVGRSILRLVRRTQAPARKRPPFPELGAGFAPTDRSFSGRVSGFVERSEGWTSPSDADRLP